jgi:hypothetical protein
MDTKKQRQRSKYDRVTQLEGRIDYLEGVMYQLFQLTERLLTTLENPDKNKSGQTLSHTKLITFVTLWAYS